ncbi:MAG: hypothetical protein H0V20_00935, partial [Actinobacteria bacterium]|nr:hypothetical protein [Actinomycetota bacterium]
MIEVLGRVPIRMRLTLAFALAMAVVLAATGLFLYLRLGSALDGAIDQSLRGRADDVSALVREGGSGLGEGGGNRLAEQDESFAQVLDADGAVVDSSPLVGDRPLLTEAQLARATEAPISIDRDRVPGSDDPVRLLATPVDAQGALLVVVVGAST